MGERPHAFKAGHGNLSTWRGTTVTMPPSGHRGPRHPVNDEQALRDELLAQARRLGASGLSQGTSGNLSARHGDGFLVTPSGMPYDELRAEDLVRVDMQGRYEHRLRPSSEWRFHRDIYAARPDAAAVVHVHPPHATALAMCRMDIPAAHYMIAVGGGDSIRCAGYHTYGTQALSDAVLEALDGRLACLMANHGMLAVGSDLAQAMWRAVEVETLARHYALALQVGRPVLLTDGEVADVLATFANYGLMSPRS